jgi:hypothetical protein
VRIRAAWAALCGLIVAVGVSEGHSLGRIEHLSANQISGFLNVPADGAGAGILERVQVGYLDRATFLQ